MGLPAAALSSIMIRQQHTAAAYRSSTQRRLASAGQGQGDVCMLLLYAGREGATPGGKEGWGGAR
eukprot:3347399-Rhodomonas_salina.1